jgi:hypothetical protein
MARPVRAPVAERGPDDEDGDNCGEKATGEADALTPADPDWQRRRRRRVVR